MTHFNGLTDAETERLDMLAEECAEVIQAISKIKRHGYESFHPADEFRTPNRVLLIKEVVDVLAVLQMMSKAGDMPAILSGAPIDEVIKRKLNYTHHQGDEG